MKRYPLVGAFPSIVAARRLLMVLALALAVPWAMLFATAEQRSYDELDRLALAAPDGVGASPLSLARYVASVSTTEVDRARILFRWIAANVEYDMDAYRRGQIRAVNVAPEDVLKTRRTICDGYARLMEAAGILLDLQMFYVTGKVNSFDSHYGPVQEHAWNVIKIRGQWKVLDVTWAAGSGSAPNGGERRFDGRWFFTDPGEFVKTHFPDEAKWQLISPPVSWRDFRKHGHPDR